MIDRQPVLVAIDGETDVKRTIEVALSSATARGADVHVLRVVPHGGVDDDERFGSATVDPHGVRVRRVTLRGEPGRVIPAYAQLHQATLLVVERDYGSSRFWRTARVVGELARQAPMPVLVLPKRKTPEWNRHGWQRILTPVDFSIASLVALRSAVDLARRHGARVTLLHALRDVPEHMVFSGSAAWEVVRRLPAQMEAVAERLRRRAAFFGADEVETDVATGLAPRAILESAARGDADLVVMGVAHRSRLDRAVFGSTLRRVLRRAPVPVLVIPVVAGAHTSPDELFARPISHRAGIDSAVGRVAA